MKTLNSIITMFILIFILNIYSYSQNTLILKDVFIPEKIPNEIKKSSVSLYHLNPTINLKNLQNVSELVIKNFPTSISQISEVKLKLTNSIIDNKTLITTGNKIKMNLPVLIRFTGRIEGEANSEVFITFIDNAIYCRVQWGSDEVFTITPSTVNPNEYIILNSRYNVPHTALKCGSVEPDDLYKIIKKLKYNQTLSNKTLQLDLAIDVCKEWYLWKFKNDTIKIRNYILSVYSMVSFIYEKETNITIHIPWLHIWTGTDPYDNETTWLDYGPNPNTILMNIPPYWKINNLNVNANIVHAITVGKIGGGGGVANYNALDPGKNIHDGNTWGPYTGISLTSWNNFTGDPRSYFDYDVKTIAHEMGHSFSCPHTHSCSWDPPIDTCVQFDGICPFPGNRWPGDERTSIMSYCDQTNIPSEGISYGHPTKMTFLTKPTNLIRTYAEQYLNEVNNIAKPLSPILISPEDNADSIPLNSNFIWKLNSNNNDISYKYHFQLSISNTFDTIYYDTTLFNNTLTISNLNKATNYYWKVATINVSGEGEFSNIWQYKTVYGIPDAPELIKPTQGDTILIKHDTIYIHGDITVKDTVISNLFKWSVKDSINSYWLQISTYSDFSEIIIDTNIVGTTYHLIEPIQLTMGNYFWQIYGIGPGGESDWSNTGRFKIVIETSITNVDDSVINNLDVSMYPNPVNDKLHITVNFPYFLNISLAIFDILGNRLYNDAIEFKQPGTNTFTISFTNLNSGLYFLQISTNKLKICKTVTVFK